MQAPAKPVDADNETTESSTLSLRRWSQLFDPALLIALAWTLTQIAFVLWPGIDTLQQRSLHVGFAVALAFAMFVRQEAGRGKRAAYTLAGLLAFVPPLYIAWNAEFLTGERIQGLDPVTMVDYVLGFTLVDALLVAGRRVLGWGITVFVLVFLAYFFLGAYLPGDLAHRYTGAERFIDTEFLSMHGIFGVPIAVSVSTVFYFVFFAAVYDVFGGGRMIFDLAFALTGRAVGGPAKAAVVSFGMLGSVSGSAVANVMSTGIFTIPLMRRVGYSPSFAGGIEAAASTGGQLVPPVMGAAAYIMAAVLLAPALVTSGVEPLVAHFFIFYFAILSMVTPPVALAAYGAASISGGSPSQTGVEAFKLSIPGFLIPFAAVMHPGLLLIGGFGDTAWGMGNALSASSPSAWRWSAGCSAHCRRDGGCSSPSAG